MSKIAKAIVAGAGQIASLGACIVTGAPAWLSGLIGAASVIAVWGTPNKQSSPEPKS